MKAMPPKDILITKTYRKRSTWYPSEKDSTKNWQNFKVDRVGNVKNNLIVYKFS